ncbi:MAG TPA: bacillithiol system redox-active protein YtxJ [Vicinamibacterales bacterium]|jgi:bacillithiol system protein YtxJ|nr:bacillithiol system redox-active protein YtxJ [Vicinamibacterales bacterium]
MRPLTTLSELHELEAAIQESAERPVLLFKHSRQCGVSCEALDELQSHIDRHAGPAAYKMITVQTHRPVSDAAARRLGVRHETPQAILLKDGKPVWSASHFRITADQLDRLFDPAFR